MSIRNAKRTILTGALALLGSGCASSGAHVPDPSWALVDGPVCRVRVESHYDTPVEAGATAGARQVYLGEVAPGGERDFGVPCAYRAVTVFRVVRAGGTGESRLGAHARALDATGVTVVTLRPTAARLSGAPRS